MFLKKLVVGLIETNCYLCGKDDSSDCVVIDPGDEADRIIYEAEKNNKNISAALLTHGHYDHIGAVFALREKYNLKVYAMKEEEPVITDPACNLSFRHGIPFVESADVYLTDGDVIEEAGLVFKVIATPGHTIGSACFYLEDENVLFSGDTLFQLSVGRTDFPTSSPGKIADSVKNKLFVLPEKTTVYPGHGPETDILYEIHNNYYV